MEAHRYEEMSQTEDHHWWFLGRRAVIEAVLRKQLAPEPGRRILDVGCGTGGNIEMLRQFGQVEGMDGSEHALELCRQRLGPDFRLHRGNIPEQVPPDRFDMVTAFDVLEHISDVVGALRVIREALQPQGVLVLTVPAFNFLWSARDESCHHYRRYTLGLLTEHLSAAGLHLRWASYFNSLLFPPIVAVRMLQQVVPRERASRSRSRQGPSRVNKLLGTLFSTERYVVPWVSLPAGVSLMAVASAGAEARSAAPSAA